VQVAAFPDPTEPPPLNPEKKVTATFLPGQIIGRKKGGCHLLGNGNTDAKERLDKSKKRWLSPFLEA
jgi:hypothetical protein